ncbi:MAG TPA: hypothetical protein VIV61_18885, partial [Candidatus Ozemobacteraceae bacterium]
QTMTMAAAPVETPALPPPPVFRVDTAAAPVGEMVSKNVQTPEPVMEQAGVKHQVPAAPVVPAVSEEETAADKDRPPVVVGEPLTGGSKKRPAKPDMQLAAATPAPASPGPVDALPARKAEPAVSTSKAFTVRARVPGGMFSESDGVLLRETATDEREKAADDLTPPSEPGFAPPPPKSFVKSAAADRDVDLSGAAASPRKQARIEEIMTAHAADIRAGALDIDQWVLSGWITVKERIDIAPPHGMKWIAVKRGSAWKAELKPVR